MAGYTDLPFRTIVRALGGVGLAYTEMVSPESVLYGKGNRRGEILATAPQDRPLGYQIYGTDPQLMGEAAKWLEEHGAQLIDVNMGCPRREITSSLAGAALLRRPAEAVRLAERVVNAVSIPVTVKLRLGWDDSSIVAAELAREMEKAGVAAIAVHGRTREQAFGGEVNLEEIRRVVESVEKIPVIGNGNIVSPDAGLKMLQYTGCAGIMVARGATRNPWLIRDLWRALQGLPPLPAPTHEQKIGLLREQFELSILHYGERHSVAIFRRWITERTRLMKWKRDKMIRLLRISSLSEMRSALEEDASSDSDPAHEPAPENVGEAAPFEAASHSRDDGGEGGI
jgi:tRNA-dihydrouridine synthase B